MPKFAFPGADVVAKVGSANLALHGYHITRGASWLRFEELLLYLRNANRQGPTETHSA